MVILHRKLINIQYPTPIQYPRRASEAPLIVLDGCLEKSRERKSPNLPCGIYLLTFLKLMFHVFLWSWCLILPTIIGLIWLTCLISIFHELQVDSQWISAGTLSDLASDPDVSWCDRPSTCGTTTTTPSIPKDTSIFSNEDPAVLWSYIGFIPSRFLVW